MSHNPYASPGYQPTNSAYYQKHRGELVMILGIMSLVLVFLTGFMCFPISLGLGIAAWWMGAADLKKMKANQMDPSGQGSTTGGMVCGIIGTVMSGLMVVGMILLLMFYAGIIALAIGAEAASQIIVLP